MTKKQEILIKFVAYLSTVSPTPLPYPTSPQRHSKTVWTRWRPLHCRLIQTRSTNARRERDLRVGPHHHRRRKRVRLASHNVASGGAITDDDGILHAGDVGDVVSVGEATDIAARWARFPNRVARRCGGGVGYGAVDAEDCIARGGRMLTGRKKGRKRWKVYIGKGSGTYKSISTPACTVMLNDFV